MLQIACKTHSFKTSVYSCVETGGVESFKYIQTKSINWVLLNQNIDFFFDKTTFQIKKALPLLRGVNEVWAYCQHNYSDAERTATNAAKPFFWDIELKNIVFNGYFNTKQIQETINVCELITVSRLQNGLLIVDGLSFDYEKGILYPTELLTLRVKETVETSGIYEESQMNLKMNLFCRQRQKGFQGLFDFNDMNQYYDTQNGVFSTTDDSIFITTDNSAFSL